MDETMALARRIWAGSEPASDREKALAAALIASDDDLGPVWVKMAALLRENESLKNQLAWRMRKL